MEACFPGPSIAVLASIGTIIVSGASVMFWQIIAAKNAHIRYVESVNADLTELVNPAIGTARGAVEEVKTIRRRQLPSGRQER